MRRITCVMATAAMLVFVGTAGAQVNYTWTALPLTACGVRQATGRTPASPAASGRQRRGHGVAERQRRHGNGGRAGAQHRHHRRRGKVEVRYQLSWHRPDRHQRLQLGQHRVLRQHDGRCQPADQLRAERPADPPGRRRGRGARGRRRPRDGYRRGQRRRLQLGRGDGVVLLVPQTGGTPIQINAGGAVHFGGPALASPAPIPRPSSLTAASWPSPSPPARAGPCGPG